MQAMTALEFRHLTEPTRIATLTKLRGAVEPILANNNLPHFTNHDVAHSDRLVGLVGDLVRPIQETEKRLSPLELELLSHLIHAPVAE